ncbi:PQQ-binding-like beta-propeller repeat protein [Natrinema ejinorense]|uniref:Pyrrolo-quinoline quinone n=1 Tax=Natrinema ejinorense TaxID=373386 RepID=A0A2A5QWG3_9EURY|nr:PQQ-binding-like beta-propeller repeat protein [Natrinema ejinorense]PCR91198.1 pyrrolo-quinoline quinone [Natrinema ejinorense]
MTSRRRVLAVGGLALTGIIGGTHRLDRPVSAATASDTDWPMARYDAAGTGYNPAASGPKDGVTIRWEREPDATVRGPAPPTLRGGTLSVVGRTSLIALERPSGRLQYERDGYSYLSSPTWANATAYRTATLAVRGIDGIYGLQAGGGYDVFGRSVGLERWHAPGQPPPIKRIANPTAPAPVAVDGVIYSVVPETNRVVALDASSGRVRWEIEIGEGLHTANRPAVRDGTVYVTCGAGHVVAVDAETGDRRWDGRVEPLDPDDEFVARQSNPPTATSAGLVVPNRRAVTLLEPGGDDIRWEYVHDGVASHGSVAVADGTVYATDGDESLHAIDLETGDEVWTAEYTRDVHPVVADGVVYVADFWLPELHAFDAETGDRRWTYELSHGPSQPIVGDGALYVVAHGRVLALEEAE